MVILPSEYERSSANENIKFTQTLRKFWSITLYLKQLLLAMTNRIHKTQDGMSIQLDVLISVDKSTKLFVAYCPALELSSYAKTQEGAKKAFTEVLQDFIEETHAKGTFDEYLLKLGWQLKRTPHVDYQPPAPDITNLVNTMMPTGAYKQELSIPAFC
jgi:hypothetical protein